MKCQNHHEIKEIQTILSFVGEVEGPYDDLGDDDKYVIVFGFEEKALPCGCRLGEGYGDVEYFKTYEEAHEYLEKRKLRENTILTEGERII